MTHADAIKLRDKYQHLVGEKFDNRDGWDIKAVIVTDLQNLIPVYEKMWTDNLDNETALKFFSIDSNNYNVVVISHQWPWGSGDLLYNLLEKYINRHSF